MFIIYYSSYYFIYAYLLFSYTIIGRCCCFYTQECSILLAKFGNFPVIVQVFFRHVIDNDNIPLHHYIVLLLCPKRNRLFLYISCYIAEILIAFLTMCFRKKQHCYASYIFKVGYSLTSDSGLNLF